MPWKINLLSDRPLLPQVGDMWPLPEYIEFDKKHPARQPDGSLVSRLSDQYWKENADKRPPLCVVMPGGDEFMIDSKCIDFTNEPAEGYYGGWKVIGEAPHITITPSLNLVGRYHGYITNGVISSDCENPPRQFIGEPK